MQFIFASLLVKELYRHAKCSVKAIDGARVKVACIRRQEDDRRSDVANLHRRLVAVIVSQLCKRKFVSIVRGDKAGKVVQLAEGVLDHATASASLTRFKVLSRGGCTGIDLLLLLRLVQVLRLGHAACHVEQVRSPSV